MTMFSFLPWILLAAIGVFLALAWRRAPHGGEKELQAKLAQETSEKDKLAGQNKQLYAENVRLQAKCDALVHEQDALKERIAGFVAKEEHKEREFHNNVAELRAAKQSLEDEKDRVRREDAERKALELAERDRLWNEHEQNVIARIQELCKRPECGLRCFDNVHLPEGFDGSFKPDVLVEFLGQYVIFDAKISRSENFANYVRDQVQKTAKKAKGRTDIASSVFLVVPTDAIQELRETILYDEGFTFYVISPEALAPVLAALKKITTYAFAEQFDPEQREKIVHLIASLDQHINERNAFDILMAQRGSAVLYDAQKLYPEVSLDVQHEKEKMRLPNFKTSSLKRLIGSVEEREKEIEALTSPKPDIDRREVKRAQSAFLGE